MVQQKSRRTVLALGGSAMIGLSGYTSSASTDDTIRPLAQNDSDDGETDTAPAEMAQVRIAHFSPDAPNVDVYVDGKRVLSDIAFGTVSEYLSIPAGPHMAKVTAAGDESKVLFEGEMTAEPGTRYTATAIGELEGDDAELQSLILKDDEITPEEGMARLRVVHASPGAPAIDITTATDETVLVDGLAFGDVMAVDVPPGPYTLDIRGDTESNDGDIVASFDVDLEGNTIHTAFASGYLTPEDEPSDKPFDLTVVSDPAQQADRPEQPERPE